MAVAYRSGAVSGNAAGTNLTATEPTGAASGDVLVALFFVNSNSATIGLPTGWTSIGSGSLGTLGKYASGYITRGASAPDLTFTNNTSAWRAVIIDAISGGVYDTASVTTGTTGSPDPPSITVGGSSAVVLAQGFDYNAWTAANPIPTGYTSGTYSAVDPPASAYKSGVASGTENPGTFSNSSSGFWIAATASVIPNPAPTYRSSSISGGSAGTNLTATEPTGAASGDILLALWEQDNSSATLGLPSGWTTLGTQAAVGTSFKYVCGYIVRGASAPSLTFTTNQNAYRECVIVAISGGSLDTSAIAASTTGAVNPPSVTSAAASSLAVDLGYYFNGWGAGIAASTGYTLRAGVSGSTGGAAQTKAVGAGAEDAGTMSGGNGSNSGPNVALAVIIGPASSGTNVTAVPAVATAAGILPKPSVSKPAPVSAATASAPLPVWKVGAPDVTAIAAAAGILPAPKVLKPVVPAAATASAPAPTVSTSGHTNVNAVPAAATASAPVPVPKVIPPVAEPVAVASVAAPTTRIQAPAAVASAVASAPVPNKIVAVNAVAAHAWATAGVPTNFTSVFIQHVEKKSHYAPDVEGVTRRK